MNALFTKDVELGECAFLHVIEVPPTNLLIAELERG